MQIFTPWNSLSLLQKQLFFLWIWCFFVLLRQRLPWLLLVFSNGEKRSTTIWCVLKMFNAHGALTLAEFLLLANVTCRISYVMLWKILIIIVYEANVETVAMDTYSVSNGNCLETSQLPWNTVNLISFSLTLNCKCGNSLISGCYVETVRKDFKGYIQIKQQHPQDII